MKIPIKKSLRLLTIIFGTLFISLTTYFLFLHPFVIEMHKQNSAAKKDSKDWKYLIKGKNTYDKKELYEIAEEYNQEGNYKKAVEILTGILEFEPNDLQTLFLRVQFYKKMNQFDLAIKDYDKIIEFLPEDTDLLFDRAYLHLDQPGKDEKYKEELDKVLKVHNAKVAREPENIEYLNARAMFFKFTGQHDKSDEDSKSIRKILDNKIEKNPDDLDARGERINVVFMSAIPPFSNDKKENIEDWKTIIPDFDILIKHDPQNADMYANRGEAYYKIGNYDMAADDFIMANKLKPKPYYISPGSGHYDKTISHEKYNRDEEGYEDTPNICGIEISQGNCDRPIAFYTAFITKNPKASRAYYYRGWAYKEIGENDKAISDLTKMIELFPEDPEAYKKRGKVYDNAGNYSEALADFNKLIEMKPTDESAYLSRSGFYFQHKQYYESIKDCNKVIERLNEIGQHGCESEGINEPTKDQLDKEIIDFLYFDRAYVGAYFRKGESYEALGNKSEAIKAYEEYIKYGEKSVTEAGIEEANTKIKALGGKKK